MAEALCDEYCKEDIALYAHMQPKPSVFVVKEDWAGARQPAQATRVTPLAASARTHKDKARRVMTPGFSGECFAADP
jgi:hypothetical protein